MAIQKEIKTPKVLIIGAVLVGFWVLVAIFADVIAPFDPNGTSGDDAYKSYMHQNAEGGVHILGTDKLGRDILSRVIYGARFVLLYASLATFVAYIIGVSMGLIAGYFRGRVDMVMSFVANLVLSFPIVVVYILVASTFSKSAFSIFFAVVFASSPAIYRIVRGLTMDICTRDYIAAAETRGSHPLYVMFVEILPNARGPLIVDSCLRIGYTTIQLGFLAFIGLGLSPQQPDWGQMIKDYLPEIIGNQYMILSPIGALISLVLGLNLLADGLREKSLQD